MRMKYKSAMCALAMAICTNASEARTNFPAVGHTYLVNFGQFVVELKFRSTTRLTYTAIRDDGTREESETVAIEVTPLRRRQFLVTWEEKDKTTVVHIEDYARKVIYTNITGPDNSFVTLKGTMKLIK
jgi:hypothetical protein